MADRSDRVHPASAVRLWAVTEGVSGSLLFAHSMKLWLPTVTDMKVIDQVPSCSMAVIQNSWHATDSVARRTGLDGLVGPFMGLNDWRQINGALQWDLTRGLVRGRDLPGSRLRILRSPTHPSHSSFMVLNLSSSSFCNFEAFSAFNDLVSH